MIELYCDFVVLYNKIHTLHINTVRMRWCATLHPTLWEHYEKLQSLVDLVWEDILQKALNKEIPTLSECIKKSTIKDDMIYDDKDEIIDDIYKDYEYISSSIGKKSSSEKNLLIQNILLWIRDNLTKLCADISREMCEDESIEKEKKEDKPKMGIKAY